MASLKYEIPLLDRNTRFALWQIKMQAVLAQMDLEDALLGIDKMPSTLTDKEKKRKDRKTLSQLHLHLSNEILQDVIKEKTATALWKRLEQICMSKTLTSKLHMKQRLYAHRLEERADTILYSRESLTIDEVYESLTSYDKMKHFVVKPDSQEESLITRGRQDRNADNDRGRTQERNPRSKSKGRSKSSNREDYSDGELLVASVNDSKVSEEWILDSGCTFHMSPYQDWFTNYEIVSEGIVLMGNNTLCKITGVGTIKVKGSTVTGDVAVASFSLSDDDITKLWHMHLGHMSENGMGTLEYIHSDLWGPSRVPSRGGANYMLTFIDDFSRKVWAFFLKQKSDVFSIVQARRDRETLDSSSYTTAKRLCRTNEQNDHRES
ncbi:hypothetical protein CXB51_005106 [Gossypium anomalum]|uniref:Retrovirus-related Pol polyprotein from transposon TNT 1-94-like beta-barrel domain-containing protein n=1 Tax=Gossypium anomalum TaxID=47600 RepID=A0A8J5ZDC6_9ROSI|nr:hypothetical protein CXB51_005106 [Gossypium anomalum]